MPGRYALNTFRDDDDMMMRSVYRPPAAARRRRAGAMSSPPAHGVKAAVAVGAHGHAGLMKRRAYMSSAAGRKTRRLRAQTSPVTTFTMSYEGA